MSRDMEFEISPFPFGSEIDPDAAIRTVGIVEEYGYDAVRFPDHVALPADIPDEYPFSETGEYPFDSRDHIYDVFQMLAFTAAVTDTVSLKSNICVVPFRHPVLLAKNALTLDALSNGRFEFGVGLGWLRTEFDVLDVPFEERGSRTDEFLNMFRRVCAEGEIAFDGRHHSFQKTGFYPRPTSEGGPPIWVGGISDAAFGRLSEFGDGWTAPGRWTASDLREVMDRITTEWDAHGRDGAPEISATLVASTESRETESEGSDPMKPADELVREVRTYADAGVTRIVVSFDYDSLDEQRERIEWFGERVIAEL